MDNTLSSTVKRLCMERGITLKDLAARMGIKPESLSRALNGNPQLSTLTNIAEALNVDTADLLSCGRSHKPSSSDFTAMVVQSGKTYLFHDKSDLKEWLM